MSPDERAVWAAAYAAGLSAAALDPPCTKDLDAEDLEQYLFELADNSVAVWHLHEFKKTYLGGGKWVRVRDIKELTVGDKIAYDWTSDSYRTGFGMRLLQLGTVVTARPGCVEAEHDHTNLYCKSGTTLVDEMFATRIVFKRT